MKRIHNAVWGLILMAVPMTVCTAQVTVPLHPTPLAQHVAFRGDGATSTLVQTLSGALGQLNKLRGVSYSHADRAMSNLSLAQRRQISFITREVETVFPGIVVTMLDGSKTIDYAQLTPVLVEAIKALNQRVSDLEEEKADLVASQQKLSTRVDELEGVKTELAKVKALLQTAGTLATSIDTGK